MIIPFILGIVSGMGVTVQTSVNDRLRHQIRSPYISSLISFTGGVLTTLLLILILQDGLEIARVDLTNEPIWMWCGGLFGAILITINLMVLPHLGSVQTVIFITLGQLLTGMVVDGFGLYRMERIPVTGTRIIGAMFVFIGVVMVSAEKGGKLMHGNRQSTKVVPIARLAAICSGIAAGTQVAVNGYLGKVIGSIYTTSLISFGGGMVCTLIICIAVWLKNGTIFENDYEVDPSRSHWWMCTGGAFGVFLVVVSVVLVRELGAGMAVIISLIGQMTGGVLIDQVGFLGIEKKPMTLRKIAGLAVMVAGAAMIQLL